MVYKGFKKLKNLRNKFYKKFVQTNSQFFYDNYRHYLKEFNCLDRFLYRNYIANFESSIKSNPKTFWNFIKSKKSCSLIPSSVFFNNKFASTSGAAANLFADFFKSNFVCDDDVPHVDFSSDINSMLDFGSMSISVDDISLAILKLKHSSKADVDGISTLLLKGCQALVAPLEILFNMSLRSGEFIDAWKVATVTPIYKCGNKSDVCNYRPISKLSNISKLFECIVRDKTYFSVKSLICSNQHGFVTRRSTVSKLAVFSEYCISAFSSGCQVDCIYTDFSKAFDKVSHKILIHKLACLGFHSIFLQWLKSYLSNRWCIVSIDGISSEPFRAMSGVPQGSILGPLLFVLFVNDISSCFSYSQFLLYAL